MVLTRLFHVIREIKKIECRWGTAQPQRVYVPALNNPRARAVAETEAFTSYNFFNLFSISL